MGYDYTRSFNKGDIKMTNLQCIICKGVIEKHYDDKGFMIWDQGNNAQPIAEGVCCDKCNMDIVLPTRLADTLVKQGGNNGKSTK